jgi:hypothetical protein
MDQPGEYESAAGIYVHIVRCIGIFGKAIAIVPPALELSAITRILVSSPNPNPSPFAAMN